MNLPQYFRQIYHELCAEVISSKDICTDATLLLVDGYIVLLTTEQAETLAWKVYSDELTEPTHVR